MSDDKIGQVDNEPEEECVFEEGSLKFGSKRFEECKRKHRNALNSMSIEIEDLNGDQRFVAEGMGIEAYKKAVEMLGGGYVYVPRYDKLIKRKKKKYVYDVFLENGADYHKTAVLCGLSVSTIRRYIRDYKRDRYEKSRNKKKMS